MSIEVKFLVELSVVIVSVYTLPDYFLRETLMTLVFYMYVTTVQCMRSFFSLRWTL